jgi:hypothetical protein
MRSINFVEKLRWRGGRAETGYRAAMGPAVILENLPGNVCRTDIEFWLKFEGLSFSYQSDHK